MLAWGTGGKVFVLGSMLALAWPLAPQPAQARAPHHHHAASGHHGYFASRLTRHWAHFARRGRGRRFSLVHYVGLQCVPFARNLSGIELRGNAVNWWDEADGLYARGNVPEPGSVLNFRANWAMRLGHVAVVTQVINSREIEIDHAHWGGWGIKRNISVIDVSPDNDWTAVRVELGRSDDYGSIYPTYGFIYDRPAGARLRMASADPVSTPVPALNPPLRDLRYPADRRPLRRMPVYDEVAEAPDRRGLNLNVGGLMDDAPDRRLQ